METLNINSKVAAEILSGLIGLMQENSEGGQLHLGHARASGGEGSARSVLGLRVLGVNEHFLPAVLKAMGIRSITFDNLSDPRPVLSLNRMFEDNSAVALAEIISSSEALLMLKLFFKNCRTIAFDDWAGNQIYTKVWRLLLQEVIALLGKEQLDFIFYLGNPKDNSLIELKEVIQLMKAFSSYGAVTLALEETEAQHLWKILQNGGEQQELTGKTLPIRLRELLGISALLIYSGTSAALLSANSQLMLSRKTAPIAQEQSLDARDHFIAGYSSALLKQMDPASSLALGLAVFGSNGMPFKEAEEVRLPGYLRSWINAL
jgi:hypothetical protein